jgi:benzil reductase ((S)-benzoin forming)
MKAIVTGYSKGLGAAIVQNLLERGVSVLGLARGRSPELGTRFPGLLSQVEIDLADTAALAAWLAGPALRDHLDGCRSVLLINNAGMVSPVGPLGAQDPAAVLQAVSLNVAAPMALAAAVVRASEGAERRILHVSSGAGRHPYPGWSVYCAGKAALDMHGQAVALDGGKGVRICSLAPGVIDTGMQAEIRATPAECFPMRERFVQLKAEGGLTAPEEAARKLIDYLLDGNFGQKPVDDLRG